MPNITLIRSHLFEAIGRSYTDSEFDELCFEFGVEVDDVMTEIVEVMTTLDLRNYRQPPDQSHQQILIDERFLNLVFCVYSVHC